VLSKAGQTDWGRAAVRRHELNSFMLAHACGVQEALKKTQLWRLRDKDGKPPGLIGWWPGRAVTFVDNHDTGSTQNHWPHPRDQVGAGYAYILTHPGLPTVFCDHYFTWGEETKKTIKTLAAVSYCLVAAGSVSPTPLCRLQALTRCVRHALLFLHVQVRRRNGIVADSSVRILAAEADLYVAEVGGRVTLKLGPRWVSWPTAVLACVSMESLVRASTQWLTVLTLLFTRCAAHTLQDGHGRHAARGE
jgi:hypothetical protein